MSTWSHWFEMGGYAPYVWSAYSIVFLGLFAGFTAAFFQKKQLKKTIQYQSLTPKSIRQVRLTESD